MAKNNKADMSCARVKKYTASDVSKAERHNERKNETYENMNVIEERIPFNVHFKTPTAPTYMEQLKQMLLTMKPFMNLNSFQNLSIHIFCNVPAI